MPVSQQRPSRPKTAAKNVSSRQPRKSTTKSTPAASKPTGPEQPVNPRQAGINDIIPSELLRRQTGRPGRISQWELQELPKLAAVAESNVQQLLDEKAELERQLEEAHDPKHLQDLRQQITELKETIKEAQAQHKALEQELKDLKAARRTRDAEFLHAMCITSQIATFISRPFSNFTVRPDVPVVMLCCSSAKASYEVVPSDSELMVLPEKMIEQTVPINEYGLTMPALLMIAEAEGLRLQQIAANEPERIPQHLRSQFNTKAIDPTPNTPSGERQIGDSSGS